jgi:hypothetical protein
VNRKEKVPLSQAPGSKKLLTGVPGIAVCSVLAAMGIAQGITTFLAVALGAYALVGLIEVLGGETIASAARNWDCQPGWKKFLISLVVIVLALGGFISLIALLAT